MDDATQWHKRLAAMRKERGISLRALSREAGVSPAALSAIERGENSPTLATLTRILRALGSDLGGFFSLADAPDAPSPVFRAEEMATVRDATRAYTLLLPKRDDVRVEMVLEALEPTEEPEWEQHDCDMAGVVLEGGPLALEIEERGMWQLRTGDAFYVRAGWRHRGRNTGTRALRMLTVFAPPRY